MRLANRGVKPEKSDQNVSALKRQAENTCDSLKLSGTNYLGGRQEKRFHIGFIRRFNTCRLPAQPCWERGQRLNSHNCFPSGARIVSSRKQLQILKNPANGPSQTHTPLSWGSAVRTEWNGRSVFAIRESRMSQRV
jgi:hypothetical protein